MAPNRVVVQRIGNSEIQKISFSVLESLFRLPKIISTSNLYIVFFHEPFFYFFIQFKFLNHAEIMHFGTSTLSSPS
jgi:hypothetical protein